MRKLELDPRVPALAWTCAWTCAIAMPGALGCGEKEPVHTVTPAPAAPAAEPAAVAPEVPVGRDVPQPGAAPGRVPPATPAQAPVASAKPANKPATSTGAKQPRSEKPAREPQPAAPPPAPSPVPALPSDPAPAPPAPATPPPPAVPAPEPAPEKKSKVTVPSTEHVKIDIPKGMQALLDADTRMQPWVNNVVAVADRCYKSKAMGTTATIVVEVTMHKNARPDADIESLPGSLSGVVACATGDLMRAKRMPLFTGPEGERHTLKIRFK